ncbi:N-acetylmuramoyl-L-alanine amidase [Solibacillus sp. FSL R7-0668]|uniref:peptidoglycan recognition protein family protein n=1 Tax=Solibacillus sp. FSL R7-0668 TaxID=2921688 RepID=UPI0030F974BC
MSYTFKRVLLPANKHKIKCPYAMTPQYITVHNTANDASAANEAAYHNRNDNQVSYHVAIDDKEAIQCIPFDRNAWHCGDGQGDGNRKSIGIEICYSKSGGSRYVAAEENAVQYIAKLLHQYGWGIDRVKQHYEWSKKNCPHRIRDEKRWGSFKQRIQDALNKLKSDKEETPMAKEAYEKDAAPAAWAKEAVEWAKANGVSDGTYLKRPATREEVIVMIHNMVNR